jgi:photosystem II stability/assembly factor-like uncharacterized protein
MNDDEKFQRELRATLDRLAREPAPDRLVARVAEIPSREPSTLTSGIRHRLSGGSLASAFGLLAVGIAIVAVAILARPGAVPPNVGASPTSTTAPTATAAPTPSPAPTSSAAAVATQSPKPQGSAVPAGFEPVSATFVSSADGWVLGTVRCNGSRCPAIVRTTDGGATWSSIPAPRTTIEAAGGLTGKGISALRFANASNGWAFGPELWATHNGGTTWARVAIGGLPATTAVAALETARGTVHAVAYDGDTFRIATSAIGADDWHPSKLLLPVGAGPVPEIQLVLAGDAGWVLQNDRTVVNGARLVAGTWQSWDPPCLDVVGPALLAASSATDLIAVCDEGVMSTPSGEHLYSSTDGGVTFARVGGRLPINSAVTVATPDGATIVVGGSKSSGEALVTSFDGGRTWPSTLNAGMVSIAQLGFTTKTQGLLITDKSGVGQMLMTHDGGRTWTRVAF